MSLNYMGLFDLVEHYGFNETNALYSKLNCDVNLITFQSLDVLKLLLKNKVYIANPNKARERQDYGADIEQLGGHTPVWCFSPFIKISVIAPSLIKSFSDMVIYLLHMHVKCVYLL